MIAAVRRSFREMACSTESGLLSSPANYPIFSTLGIVVAV